MKYKVGDKFLAEIEVFQVIEGDRYPYKMLSHGARWSEAALDELRRPDDMTAEEAWEIARKIVLRPDNGGYTAGELENFFGTHSNMTIFRNNTLQQAKAQIEAWKAEQEIKVGDVVKTEDSIKAVVLDIHDEYFDVLVEDGCAEEWYKSKITKTGRHIDIQGVLEQIGGTE